MRFCRIKRLTLQHLTIKDPTTYGIQIGYAEDFTVQNITFDYRNGAPKLWNMDGVHIEGHCKNGLINRLTGACHDDMVAITADDSLYGPIENITVEDLEAFGGHSAVRILSHGLSVKNVTIRNIRGSFYTYCIGLTKYHPDEARGDIQNVTIENITASACRGTPDVSGGRFPFLWVEGGLTVKDLKFRNITRTEETYPTPMLQIDRDARIEGLTLSDLHQVNKLAEKTPFLVLDGEIHGLLSENLKEE